MSPADRRHRMDERNRIRRIRDGISVILMMGPNSERHEERLANLWDHCQAELDILNAELGLNGK